MPSFLAWFLFLRNCFFQPTEGKVWDHKWLLVVPPPPQVSVLRLYCCIIRKGDLDKRELYLRCCFTLQSCYSNVLGWVATKKLLSHGLKLFIAYMFVCNIYIYIYICMCMSVCIIVYVEVLEIYHVGVLGFELRSGLVASTLTHWASSVLTVLFMGVHREACVCMWRLEGNLGCH